MSNYKQYEKDYDFDKSEIKSIKGIKIKGFTKLLISNNHFNYTGMVCTDLNLPNGFGRAV